MGLSSMNNAIHGCHRVLQSRMDVDDGEDELQGDLAVGMMQW